MQGYDHLGTVPVSTTITLSASDRLISVMRSGRWKRGLCVEAVISIVGRLTSELILRNTSSLVYVCVGGMGAHISLQLKN